VVERYIPPIIYCPRCGRKIFLQEIEGDELERIKSNGYIAGGKGMCECGVVVVLCAQELPKSPTFSLFFDIYQVAKKTNIVGSNKTL